MSQFRVPVGMAQAKWLLVTGLAWAAAGCAPSTAVATPSASATRQVVAITAAATASEPAALVLTPTREPSGAPAVQAGSHTATPVPSRTPRNYDRTLDAIAIASQPTATPSPTVTPTFDPTHAAPGTLGQCPARNPALAPGVDYDFYTLENVGTFYRQILAFLNAGGTYQALIRDYRQHRSGADERVMREGDVTGDGVLDLVVTAPDSVVVYVCDHGRYQDYAATNIETYHDSQPIIVTITDMNRDGIDEIVTLDGDDRVRDVNVVEWDGHTFQLLNAGKCSLLLGPSWPYARDTNGDGKLELVLKQAIPIWSEYVDGLPWRKETRTCAWNGTAFVLTRTEITTTPQFRFQAVQDGDRASLAGDYAKALGLYQQAIFDDKLEPWSLDRYFYETGQFQTQLSGGTETPVPFPTPDPAEYPLLAAYARYRIMLLHVVGNHLPEAKTVYDTLQDKYPSGQVGHVMAELAAAFWSEYQGSHNVGRACDQAVAYARLHPTEVLAYLGNGVAYDKHFGDQSLIYTPETVCPFR